MIVDGLGEEESGYFDGFASSHQKVEIIGCDRRIDWWFVVFPLLPIGEKFIQTSRFEAIAA